MKRIQQLTSCYLVLCLAFAGVIGISPVLHQVVEHGGNGAAHTHQVDASNLSVTAHTQHHGHGHTHIHSERAGNSKGFFAHSHKPFKLPTIPLRKLWDAFSHLLEPPTSSEPSPSNDGPCHEHHSLFHLMASGLVEQPVESPLFSFVPSDFIFYNISLPTAAVARDGDAQTATRGPPSSQS